MIVGLFPGLLAIGGVQTVSRHLAASLAWMADGDRAYYRLLSFNDPAGIHELTVSGTRFSFRGFARNRPQFLAALLSAAAARPRLVLASHPFLASASAFVKALSPSAASIVSTHGVEVWSPLPFIRRHALRRANLVLAPSRFTAERLLSAQQLSPEKVRTLPWALDPNFLRLVQSGARAPLPFDFPRNRPTILAVGRWDAAEAYKGVDLLIAALPEILRSVPDAALVAVGAGTDLPHLRSLASQHGLQQSVIFLPPAQNESLVTLYEAADVFALPSSGEGFGLVYLEAMAVAKPVVALAHGGALDIVENCSTGFLIPPQDTGALAPTLTRLLLDPSLRLTLGREAHRRALTSFRFDDFRNSLCHLAKSTT
jgi:glycosyltransferase involved in cell wall biosynthesis